MPTWLQEFVPFAISLVWVVCAAFSSAHAILHKREVRAAIGWVGVLWLAPFLGFLLYWVLGVNRIRRKALKLRTGRKSEIALTLREAAALPSDASPLRRDLQPLVYEVTGLPLVSGNRVEPLVNGDETFPAMLAAIEEAHHRVYMLTYIFETDRWGMRFVDALSRAQQRGVEVRVLVDALGDLYSWPNIGGQLRLEGVPVRRFMPLRKTLHFNLRNHRKLLIADDAVAFTGGMNIRSAAVIGDNPEHPMYDTHFRVEGPVVRQLHDVFVEDWAFASEEELAPALVVEAPAMGAGEAAARAIPDGPDEDLNRIPWTLAGAIACAREQIQIMTPYFLPDETLASALNIAAMKGVRVDILVPDRSNLRLVDWAMWGGLWRFVDHGCRIWFLPAPFDHSKLMVVDREWSLVGSSNWDPRSLRLNFELGLEVYDRSLASRLTSLMDVRRAQARQLMARDIHERSLPLRLRDGLARLLTPYL